MFPERREGDESSRHDSRPVPRVREDDAGRPGLVEGARHIQPLVGARPLQLLEERPGRRAPEARRQQGRRHDQFLLEVLDVQGGGDRRRCCR